MDDNGLKWEINSTKTLLHTPVFDVTEQNETAANGIKGDYVAMKAPDWAMVIAQLDDSFILVRQWRHASEKLTLEFPGGVVDSDEEPADAARRELLEETGFEAGELIHLGSVSPNPALFKNRFHVFLARKLRATGDQKLDDDELLTYETMPVNEVIERYGGEMFDHALMGTALALYLKMSFNKQPS